MKLLLMLLVSFILIIPAKAQNTSWFHGVWNGETYFPNGPITKRIIIRLDVTKVSGSSFTATLSNLYPNDTTVRLQRSIKGTITKNGFRFISNEQIYIRDPRTQNFWHDCTGCPIQSDYSINSSQVVITLTTTNCGDVCDGQTTFSRDTSDLDSAQKIQLANWFGLSVSKPVAKATKKKQGTIVSNTKKPVDNSLQNDSLLAKKNLRYDTIAANHKPAKKDSLAAKARAKRDSAIIARRASKKDTTELAALQNKTDSLSMPVLSRQDTLPDALTMRTTNLINTFKVTSPHITVQLFDNAEIDGDMVSVYHNGRLIANRQTLTHKAITITINASKDDPHHEFIMIADNLGLTPPNTALMRITAGGQKFELEVSSDFDNNAKITIDYTGEE